MSLRSSMLGRWILVALVASSLATPWALLQSVAWVSMVVEYSRQSTFAQALSMTFDGKHPCKLCQIIQTNQAKEKHPTPKAFSAVEKIDFGLPPEPFQFVHPPVPAYVTFLGPLAGEPADPPPLPPPRLV